MEQRNPDYARLTTEGRNPRSMHIDTMSTEDMMRCINEEDKLVPLAVEKEVPNIAKAVDAITAAVKQGGRLIYTGCGTSGRLGVLDASECPPTYGTDPDLVVGVIAGGDYALRHAIEGAEDSFEAGQAAMEALQVSSNDVVVGISAAGGAAYVIGTLDYARKQGAVTVSLTCNHGAKLDAYGDICITPIVGPEVVTGSTRMKAGTATKLVLNMLTTGVMIKTGKVYENLMVHMRPTNAKLRARAIRMIGQLTGREEADCTRALDACDGNIRAAADLLKGEAK